MRAEFDRKSKMRDVNDAATDEFTSFEWVITLMLKGDSPEEMPPLNSQTEHILIYRSIPRTAIVYEL